jgi:hypothetical protein
VSSARALLPAVLTIGWALAIGLVVRHNEDDIRPPDADWSAVWTIALLAAPGLVSAVAATTGARILVVPAGLMCIAQSTLSFSFITLPFAPIGALHLLSATADDAAEPRPRWRPGRTIVMVLTAIPLALLLVRVGGLLGVLLLFVVAGVAPALRRGSDGPRLGGRDALLGVVVLALLLGAWFTHLGVTESACWSGRYDATGNLVWQRIPSTDSLTLEPGEVVEHCESSSPTTLGRSLSAACLTGAVLVGLGARRRPDDPEVEQEPDR